MKLDKDGHTAGSWCDPCDACSEKMDDEWLAKAADEIAAATDNDGCIDALDGVRWTSNEASVLAILRKHRDGKA